MIDNVTAQRIKDAADIVDVVSDYVHLIRRGSNMMGLCPFHNERTPSFSVNRQRNFCYCFSCHKGGSPVNFIMEKEGLSYNEALRHLAKKYGIEIKERQLSDKEREEQTLREEMLVANEWSMQLMEKDMVDTQEGMDVALQYFVQRGVTEEAMKAFHLGYAMDNSHRLVDSARQAGFNIQVFKNLGLIGTGQHGHDYDRFRGRVIFPILSNSGKVIAFGGRDIKGSSPAKYINSPESLVYKKSNVLYGIFQARPSIVSAQNVFLVEGYMDVIGMWQAGIKNVVASSGTALTDGQIALIHRLTDNITLIYDGDPAGIKASLRGIDMLLSHGMNVKVLLLPDGDDPDSFARKHSPSEFQTYIKEHQTDIIQFKIQVLLADDGDDPQQRIHVINSVVNSIAHIADPVARDVYIRESARRLNVSEESVAKACAVAVQKVKQQLKTNRNLQQLQEDRKREEDTLQEKNFYNEQHPEANSTPQIPKQETLSETHPTSLAPLEATVIKYCLRYGFVGTFPIIDGGEDEPPLSVLEYVQQEICDGEFEFTNQVYNNIFQELLKLTSQFEQSLSKKKHELLSEKEKKLKTGYHEIAQKDLSTNEIKIRENRLEKEVVKWYDKSIEHFITAWPQQVMASHENNEIRNTVTELLYEKHHLSNIYSKLPQNEKESDKLEVLVPRSISEWKSEKVSQKQKALLKELHTRSDELSLDEQQKILLELQSLMTLQRDLAKEMGDRTLSPKR